MRVLENTSLINKYLLTEPVDNFVDKKEFEAVTLDTHWPWEICLNFMQSLLSIQIKGLQKFEYDILIT